MPPGAVCRSPPRPAEMPRGRRPQAGQAPGPAAETRLEQRTVADQFQHLEDVLLRMAELNAATDPRRAALLKKAVEQSKEQLIDVRFERLVELLGKDQLSRAMENQADLDQDLRRCWSCC